MPSAVKTEVVAELRAIRAFYHYLLMDNFGSIPLITTFESGRPIEQVSRWKAPQAGFDPLRGIYPKELV